MVSFLWAMMMQMVLQGFYTPTGGYLFVEMDPHSPELV